MPLDRVQVFWLLTEQIKWIVYMRGSSKTGSYFFSLWEFFGVGMQDTGVPKSLIKYTCSSWGSPCGNFRCSDRGLHSQFSPHRTIADLQYEVRIFETVKKLGYFFLCQNHFFKVWSVSVASQSHMSKSCKPHMPIIHYTKIRTVLQYTCTHK